MQTTEKKMNNKIWLSILSVGVVIALVLGIVALRCQRFCRFQ